MISWLSSKSLYGCLYNFYYEIRISVLFSLLYSNTYTLKWIRNTILCTNLYHSYQVWIYKKCLDETI